MEMIWRFRARYAILRVWVTCLQEHMMFNFSVSSTEQISHPIPSSEITKLIDLELETTAKPEDSEGELIIRLKGRFRNYRNVSLCSEIGTRGYKMEKKPMRVLSIQSHVVSGYVGNKCATFPLQVLGFEVDTINSVQFSNHTGYGSWKGQVLEESELVDLVKGLSQNNLDNYSHMLTGYVRSAPVLKRIVQIVREFKKVNPSLVYVCDPVIGDNGKIYVPQELVPVYKKELVPLANIITPNQFELELLSDRTINSMEDALKAIDAMHEAGVEIVFLSSSDLGPENQLLAIVSRKIGESRKVMKIAIPRLPVTFTGTGDLTAALFLAWYSKTGDLQATVERTMATLQAVVKRTFQMARQSTEGDNPTVSSLELKLIQSKSDIENPTCAIAAENVEF